MITAFLSDHCGKAHPFFPGVRETQVWCLWVLRPHGHRDIATKALLDLIIFIGTPCIDVFSVVMKIPDASRLIRVEKMRFGSQREHV